MRTIYLNNIIPCEESEACIKLLQEKLDQWKIPDKQFVVEKVNGHIYEIHNKQGHIVGEEIRFVCRSGKAVTYEKEWPGLQTQELVRGLIDHVLYWSNHSLADLLRKIIWYYEARAYRRKRQELNRDKPEHTVTEFPYTHHDIETKDIGEDGHIQYMESEYLYYATFGGMDSEPIPGANPFEVTEGSVYSKARRNIELMF